MLPYFPLANGLLTGKYVSPTPPKGTRLAMPEKVKLLRGADLQQLRRFVDFADGTGMTPTQVAIGWLAANPAVPSVIAGATTVEQVLQNAASANWKPTPVQLEELDAIFPAPPPIALF